MNKPYTCERGCFDPRHRKSFEIIRRFHVLKDGEMVAVYPHIEGANLYVSRNGTVGYSIERHIEAL